MPNIFMPRRSSRINLWTTGIVVGALLVQIDYVDYYTSESVNKKLHIPLLAAIVTGVVVTGYLFRDIAVNWKNIG